ncbi:MAG: hypothetical protein KGH94_04485 [Candidatus Micrarchaeota archaeon]|nr:hypothetical protein [Candidatus Micrarchaeota archaeon]
MTPRLQSGIELLSTYGLMIIAVVIGVALLVVLSTLPSNTLPHSCYLYGSLKCLDLAYTVNNLGGSTGSDLIVYFGMSLPGAINVSSFKAVAGGMKSASGYCTANGVSTGVATIPQGSGMICVASFNSPLILGQTYKGTFNMSANYCPGAVGNAPCPSGSKYTFAGSWRSQGENTLIPAVNTNAPIQNPSGPQQCPPCPPGSVQYYLCLSITNSQMSATPAPFQQEITFNPQTYSPYESGDLGNIRFYQGGSAIASWCESGCSSTSTSAIFWVNLPSGIGANSMVTVQMAFLTKGSEYSGSAGEAPQLSPTFGQYDNGASVFTNYWNDNQLSPSSLPSNWAGSEDPQKVSYYTTPVSMPTVLEALAVYPPSTSNFGDIPLYAANFVAVGGNGFFPFVGVTNWISLPQNIQFGCSHGLNQTGSGTLFAQYNTSPNVRSLYVVSLTNEFCTINYAHQTSVPSPNHLYPATYYASIFSANSLSAIDWYRIRAYPPNNVMPSVQFSVPQTGCSGGPTSSLAISISPASASIYLGQSVTFTNATIGGTPPYAYSYSVSPSSYALSGNTVTFLGLGSYSVVEKVTDANGLQASSQASVVTVQTLPILAYTQSAGADPFNISVINTQTMTSVNVTIDGNTHDASSCISVLPNQQQAFFVYYQSEGLFAYNAITGKVTTVEGVPSVTTSPGVSPDSAYVYATSAGATYIGGTGPSYLYLRTISTATDSVVNTLKVQMSPSWSAANNRILISPDGSKAYIPVIDTSNYIRGAIVTVSLGPGGAATVTNTISEPGWPLDIALSPDGTKLYAIMGTSGAFTGQWIQTFNMQSDTLSNTIFFNNIQAGPGGPDDGWGLFVDTLVGNSLFALARDDGFLVKMDTTTYAVNVIGVPPYPNINANNGWYPNLALSNDGSMAYIASEHSNGYVYAINTISGATVANIPVGTDPVQTALTPDGKYVYVTNLGGTISVISTSNNVVVKTIKTEAGAEVLAIAGGNYAIADSFDT